MEILLDISCISIEQQELMNAIGIVQFHTTIEKLINHAITQINDEDSWSFHEWKN